MLSDVEKKEYEELKSLLYTGTISQYGKRKLIDIIEKQSKEIEELKEENKKYIVQLTDEQYRKLVDIIRDETSKEWKDKIKAKIEEIENTGIDVAWEQVNYTIREQDRAKIQVLQSLLEKEQKMKFKNFSVEELEKDFKELLANKTDDELEQEIEKLLEKE